jgi:antitoxin FitA
MLRPGAGRDARESWDLLSSLFTVISTESWTTLAVDGTPMTTNWQSLGFELLAPICSHQGSVEEDRMPSILVRGLDDKILHRLKERARLNGRSLQQEVKDILDRAAGTLTMYEARRLSERWRRRLSGRSFSDSARSIREDRYSR